MIVVTGGAGFIGSNVVAGLNQKGYRDVMVADRLDSSDKWRNLSKLALIDYVDKDDLFKSMSRVHVGMVIHLGARTDTMDRDAKGVIEDNFTYSKRLWEFCARRRVPLVFASSASVYGDGSQGFQESIDLSKTVPLNPYAFSKLMFDRWVIAQSSSINAAEVPSTWAGLRFYNVYGPGESCKGSMASMARQAYIQIVEKGRVSLFKSNRPEYQHGEQKRDFIYVQDIVDIILFLFELQTLPAGFYNCGSGTARSFNELAHMVFRELSRTPEIEYIDMPPGLDRQYQYFTEADVSRLRKIGFERKFTRLEDGIHQYVQKLKIAEG